MGMYVSVRGWIELAHAQLEEARSVVETHRDEHHSGGWAFPSRPFNWTAYVFYGGDLRESSVDWLRNQVAALAKLPPVDDDGDRPVGFFLLTDERQRASAWVVRDGLLDEVPAPLEFVWFAHRG